MELFTRFDLQTQYEVLFQRVISFFSQQNWIAIFIILVFTVAIERITFFIISRLTKLTTKTKTNLDDRVIAKCTRPISNYVLLLGFFVIIHLFRFPLEPIDVKKALVTTIKILFVLNTIWLLVRLTSVLGDYFFSKVVKTNSRLDDQLVPIFVKSIKIFLYILCAVYIIQALGYSISGVVAGLGIGGLAVAMAAKDTLANLFGSIMLISDRPFRVGDWIKVGTNEGIVEQIGFRSTRIRTFEKTLISVPNSLIANDSINNFSKMPARRVKLSVGVTYDTSANQMESLVNRLRDFLKNHPEVNQDFFLVDFTDFGASSLDILVYYFTKTTDWANHLQLRQDINLSIMRIIEEMGLSIAFPTQTVHVKSDRG